MADFENVEPDEYKYLGCNYNSGRPNGIQGITIHHMAGDLNADDCNRVWASAETSAHYSIDRNGYIVQHVDDGDRAWACGNSWANDVTISIEHANNNSDPWTVYDAAIESGAHFVAGLCKVYGLGRPEWMVNVFPHKHWSSTECPGELAGSQNAQYMERAQYWYDVMTGNAPQTTGWIQQSGKWWYKHSDGSYTTNGWELIDNKWYHFDSEGWMQTGWILVDEKWYYLTDSGAMATDWVQKDSKWYYTDPVNGDMKTGWIQKDGKWYWLASDGAMLENQVSEINGKFYAFDQNGAMMEGNLTLTTSDDGSIKAEKA